MKTLRSVCLCCLIACGLPSLWAADTVPDTLNRATTGFAIDAAVGNVMKIDAYERQWLHDNGASTFGAEWRYTPALSDDFAADYGRPTLGAGLRFGRYNGVTMQKSPSPDWGQAEMVDYRSRMGNTLTAYGFFERPLWKDKHWAVDYRIDIGIGWGWKPYNKHHNVDNELIGSHLLIYFGAGAHATYYIRKGIGLRAGLEFAHHSNGALNRPNKGANFVGPMLGVVYDAVPVNSTRTPMASDSVAHRKPYPYKRWYCNLSVGIGGKTLLEDWLLTQYGTAPTDASYRKESFHVYHAFTVSADAMYRYARRWSSGVGVDVFYASAAHRIADVDRVAGLSERHSPWSVGIAAKHEVWWHDLALTMSLGMYLYRKMGFTARDEEKPYYEHIGLKYTFPRLHGLFIGADVKAHLTKADQTRFYIGMRLF